MESTENPRLEAALDYAALGRPVIPLHTPTDTGCSCLSAGPCKVGKHPRTKHGLLEAKTDEAQIRKWWRMWPDANIGIVTGPRSHLVVLDIDGEAGEASLALLEQQEERLPATREVRTGDGRHLWFELPEGALAPTKDLGNDLHFRANGAYIVAPPSLHENGHQYAWANDLNIAVCPAWILTRAHGPNPLMASTSTTSPSSPISVSVTSDEKIPEGRRNTGLARVGGALRSLGHTESEIRNDLRSINQERCEPPLEVSDVDGIAASMATYPPYPTNGRTLPKLGSSQAEQALSELEKLQAMMCSAYDNPHLDPDAGLAVRLARLIEQRYMSGQHRNNRVKLNRAEIADRQKFGKEIYKRSKIQKGRDRLKEKKLIDVQTLRAATGRESVDPDTGEISTTPHSDCWYLRDRPLFEKLQQLAEYRKPKSI